MQNNVRYFVAASGADVDAAQCDRALAPHVVSRPSGGPLADPDIITAIIAANNTWAARALAVVRRSSRQDVCAARTQSNLNLAIGGRFGLAPSAHAAAMAGDYRAPSATGAMVRLRLLL